VLLVFAADERSSNCEESFRTMPMLSQIRSICALRRKLLEKHLHPQLSPFKSTKLAAKHDIHVEFTEFKI
jgi:hypothetical protein